MEKLNLRKLGPADKPAFLKALSEWDNDSGFTWVRGYEKGMNFRTYLQWVDSFDQGEIDQKALYQTLHYSDLIMHKIQSVINHTAKCDQKKNREFELA